MLFSIKQDAALVYSIKYCLAYNGIPTSIVRGDVFEYDNLYKKAG